MLTLCIEFKSNTAVIHNSLLSVISATYFSSTNHCCASIYNNFKNSKAKAIQLQACGQTLRVLEGLGSQISRQLAHEGGKVVSPLHRPPLPPRIYSWYSYLLEAESTPGP
jgi:hypothetical protein